MMIFFLTFFMYFLQEPGFLVILAFTFFTVFVKCFPSITLSFLLSFDFVSFLLIFLTILIVLTMVLSGFFETRNDNSFLNLLFLLFLSTLFLLLVFMFCSFLMFYIFFELIVIPIFIIIISWGYSFNRFQSSMFMFLYTFIGSLPLLILILGMFFLNMSFNFFYYFFLSGFNSLMGFLWVFILVVFMVKLPVFIFHMWLPSAHVDAPVLGSMILAGVLLKLGGYGFMKCLVYSYILFKFISWNLSIFCLWGSFLVGMLCMRQIDMKMLIAYSSVVHMGPVMGCLTLMGFYGFTGGYWMMISHGFCSSCMFFLLNLFYFWVNSRSLYVMRGGLLAFPTISYIWFFFCTMNMGCPPSFNFFSELFLCMSSFMYSMVFIFFFFLILLVSGFYNMMLYVFFGHGSLSLNMSFFLVFSLKDMLVSFIYGVPLFFFLGLMDLVSC